jgi:hypothetical protein
MIQLSARYGIMLLCEPPDPNGDTAVGAMGATGVVVGV